MNPFVLILEGETAAAGGSAYSFIMLAILFAVMYFFIIRPEKKRKEKAQALQDSITNGDEITTIGGITGKVVQVTEDTITFETGEDRVRIQVKKWAVSTTARQEAAEAAAQSSGGLFGKK